jgi:hypothetical protein
MSLTNLDNERGNLITLINSLKTSVDTLESSSPVPQPPIADAVTSAEETTPTVGEFDVLVTTVNDILSALRAYGVIENNESTEG